MFTMARVLALEWIYLVVIIMIIFYPPDPTAGNTVGLGHEKTSNNYHKNSFAAKSIPLMRFSGL